MKNRRWERYVMLASIVIAVCLGSIFSANAASKIKSKSVTINTSKVTVGVGDIVTLDAIMKPTNSTDTISWSSSQKSVAVVNKYGVVTAVSEGSTTITAKTSSKKTAKCVVTVKKTLSEKEISDLIVKNCLSEETVMKMIADNAVTESQVLALIQQNSGGNGSSSDWQDGKELSIHKQKLPLTLTCFQRRNYTYEMTITDCTVAKYHSSDEWEDIPQKYKYVLTIKGTVPDHSDTSKLYWGSIDFVFLNSSGDSAPDYRFYPLLRDSDDGNIVSTYSENDDGSFVLTVEQYNIFNDYDKYMICGFNFECESPDE